MQNQILLDERSHLRAVFLESNVEFNLRMRAALLRLRAGEIDDRRFMQLRNNAIGNALQVQRREVACENAR